MKGARIAAFVLFSFTVGSLFAAPQAELWPRWEAHDPAAETTVDHSAWQAILDTYLTPGSDERVALFDYANVAASDRRRLDSYIRSLEQVEVSALNREVQLAYWLNMYNAVTIDLILENMPLESIQDLRRPWDQQLVTVEGEALTLNDIEHRIIRPIWRDPRIHYGVNCASIGCPDLMESAFSGANVDDLLEAAARRYINHPRGVSVDRRRLTLSSIYNWFSEDWGDEDDILEHLRRYAEGELRTRIAQASGRIRYEYDWSLNAAATR